MKKSLTLVFSLAMLLLTGCAHYQLGSGNNPGYRTIAFAPIDNRSFAPQIHAVLTDALFRQFAQGGGMVVEEQKDNPEVILQVIVTDFQKYIGATKSTDTGSARSLAMTLKATATLSDASGKQLYSQEFSASQEFYADTGMSRAESEGLPQLADALAQKIYRAVVSKW